MAVTPWQPQNDSIIPVQYRERNVCFRKNQQFGLSYDIFLYFCNAKRECSSVGRASASQAEGRGFEPRYSLAINDVETCHGASLHLFCITPEAFHIQGRTCLSPLFHTSGSVSGLRRSATACHTRGRTCQWFRCRTSGIS